MINIKLIFFKLFLFNLFKNGRVFSNSRFFLVISLFSAFDNFFIIDSNFFNEEGRSIFSFFLFDEPINIAMF